MYVLTMVSANPDANLWPKIRTEVESLLSTFSTGEIRFDWLSQDKAADFFIDDIAMLDTRRALTALISHQHWLVDFLLQKTDSRKKKMLIADMEATIIGQEMVDEMAAIVGCEQAVAEITAQAMAGQMEFAHSLKMRMKLFAGQSTDLLTQVMDKIVLNKGAKELIQTMNQHGAYTALVTGGFQPFADLVQAQCGFDVALGNQLEVINSHLTGNIQGDIIDRKGKQIVAQKLLSDQGLKAAQMLAVGDGANDLDMLNFAGLAVGYFPKPILEPEVDLVILHTDFHTLLYVQGYREKDFVVDLN